MDLIRTTDHIQNRPEFADYKTAPLDSSKPIANLSEFKGSAQARGRANAGQAPDQYSPNRLQSMNAPPPSRITQMAKGILATQRRQIASQPSSSQDPHIAEHYKASYILEDRGGATAPGAELSLRPTGKAAGGMQIHSTHDLQVLQSIYEKEMNKAQEKYENLTEMAITANSDIERQSLENAAETHRQIASSARSQYNAITNELQARSNRSGGSSRS